MTSSSMTTWMDAQYPEVWRPYFGKSGYTSYFPRKGRMLAQSGSDQARWDSLPFVEDEEMLATCDEVEEATRSKATQAEQQASASAISSSESFRYAPWKPIHSRRSPDVGELWRRASQARQRS